MNSTSEVKCPCCLKVFQMRNSDIARGRKYCSRKCYRVRQRSEKLRIYGEDRKRCPKCNSVKLLKDFSSSGKRSGDGLAGWCRECNRKNEKNRRLNPLLIDSHRVKYETDMKFRSETLLKATAKRCKRLNLTFGLDVDWLAERLRNGRCELTGLAFDMSVVNRRRNSHTPSIDRVIAGAGYTKDNCRVVLYAVNCALNDWGLGTFLPIAKALAISNAETEKLAA